MKTDELKHYVRCRHCDTAADVVDITDLRAGSINEFYHYYACPCCGIENYSRTFKNEEGEK